jgi:hypothetical protein
MSREGKRMVKESDRDFNELRWMSSERKTVVKEN